MAEHHGPSEEIQARLRELGIRSGAPRGEELFAMVLYSDASAEDLVSGVEALRATFDEPDHLQTKVYAAGDGTGGAGERAVVSMWTDPDGAETAAEALAGLDAAGGAEGRRHGDRPGFATVGMFYRTRPGERDVFTDRFAKVVELLEGMDGHVATELFANVEDGDDMFVRSRWEGRADALAFFRSDAFKETVEWGREVLAERPRHVFLV